MPGGGPGAGRPGAAGGGRARRGSRLRPARLVRSGCRDAASAGITPATMSLRGPPPWTEGEPARVSECRRLEPQRPVPTTGGGGRWVEGGGAIGPRARAAGRTSRLPLSRVGFCVPHRLSPGSARSCGTDAFTFLEQFCGEGDEARSTLSPSPNTQTHWLSLLELVQPATGAKLVFLRTGGLVAA